VYWPDFKNGAVFDLLRSVHVSLERMFFYEGVARRQGGKWAKFSFGLWFFFFFFFLVENLRFIFGQSFQVRWRWEISKNTQRQPCGVASGVAFLAFSLYCIWVNFVILNFYYCCYLEMFWYRRSRLIAWTPHSILGIKALRNNVKEQGTKAASPCSN
jgi:hypothetical protein